MNIKTNIQKIGAVSNKNNKFAQILLSLALSLLIIFISIKITLMFKPLYYFDIKHLNIEKQSGFSKNQIIENYDYIINYLLSPKSQKFMLPSIPYSKYGQIHFMDVKRIFTSIDILLLITGFISIIGSFLNFKKGNYYFLKYASSILILLPIILLTSFFVNFDAAFTVFHKVFFRNDYWQFDPALDPVINILPEQFFYHSALFMVIIVIICIVFLKLLYKKLDLKNKLNLFS